MRAGERVRLGSTGVTVTRLGHPAVASVVVGARSPAEVADAVAMFSHDIPGQLWADPRQEGLLSEEVPTP